jgi:GNAT superfamily N-acetyltransferase
MAVGPTIVVGAACAMLALSGAGSYMAANQNIVVRQAVVEDLPQIADFRWRLKTEDAPDFDVVQRDAFVLAFVTEQSQSRNFLHWVAEVDGHMAAVMSIGRVTKLLSPDQRPAAFGYLTNCYTLPGFRRRGIGSRLLAVIIAWAREQGYELLLVWPSDESYAFYGRSGFRKLGDPLILDLQGRRYHSDTPVKSPHVHKCRHLDVLSVDVRRAEHERRHQGHNREL